jgi:adenylate cyclase
VAGPELGAADPRCPGCGTPVDTGQRFCQECGARLPREGAEPGERRILCAIFCDMVGSTALAERIGEEPMHEVLDRLFQIAGEEVSRFGGTINKHLGDGFLALVGTPVAHEDHAVRAVLAALALQERIAQEWPEGSDPRVQVRVGVSTGVVVVGQLGSGSDADLTAIGDTVNVASRLEALAGPGTVLISGATEEAARGYVAVEPAGSADVRGREEPVEVFLATGRGARRSALDDPRRRVSPLVGRRRQLTALAELLDEARGGRG